MIAIHLKSKFSDTYFDSQICIWLKLSQYLVKTHSSSHGTSKSTLVHFEIPRAQEFFGKSILIK